MSNIFPQRSERLDWQLVAEVEPMVVVMGAVEECEKLQGVLPGIAFCSLDAEFGKEILESTRGLAKLFRLAQLIIQYLVHCQDQLSSKLEKTEEREKDLQDQIESVEEQNNVLMTEVKVLRKETKKRRKMLAAQQECLFKGTDPKEFQKCIFCTKTFVNQSFLLSHINRRHKEEMVGKNLTKVQLNSFLNMATSDTQEQNEIETTHYPKRYETQDDIREVLQDLKRQLNKAKDDEVGELVALVKNQQDQINDLQNLSRKQPMDTKPTVDNQEDGKLKAQEIFWQAQVKTLEDKILADSRESRHEIEKLKESFENEKRKQKKSKRKDKRRARREKEAAMEEHKIMVRTEGAKLDSNNKMLLNSNCQENIANNNIVDLTKATESVLVPKNSNDIIDKSIPKTDVKQTNKAFIAQKEASYKKVFVENVNKNDTIDSVKGHTSDNDTVDNFLGNVQDHRDSDIREDSQPTEVIKPAFSAISIQSAEHEYEAPISFHTSKDSMLDMIEKNPNKLEQYRSQAQILLADQLEHMGVNSDSSTITKQQLNNQLRQLKEHRKSLPNSSELSVLREQCKEEVDKLASQSSMKKGSLKRRMSKSMSSFRKQIYNSLQNLRFKRKENKEIERKAKKRSPKKNVAPQPPNITSVQNKDSEAMTTTVESNVYVPSPKRLPPKPVPRQSKIRKPEPEPVSEISDTSEEEEEEEEEEDDEGDISSIVQDLKRNCELKEENREKITIVRREYNDNAVQLIEENENNSDENDERSVYSEYSVEEDPIDDIKEKEKDQDTEDEQASLWDSEEENEIEEIAEVHQEPEEIKLRRPRPGTKIADLTNIIETQLHRRSVHKPAGGVDPLQAAMDGMDPVEVLQDRINLVDEELAKGQSMTDLSTNTLGTSMWGDNGSFHTSRPGSAATLQSGPSSRPGSRPGSGQLRSLKPPQPRTRITSWDSD